MNIIIIGLGITLLSLLLYFDYKKNTKGLLPTKTLLSMLFVIAAIMQPHPNPLYYYLLLTGLLFCLVGDVSLAFPQETMFLIGLVSFLIGHIFYIIGFFSVAHVSNLTWVGTFVVMLISGSVFLWLKQYLGTMKIPVFVYVVVITVMMSGAWSVLGASDFRWLARVIVFSGAACFYLSDILVAKSQFFKNEPINQFVGLPLYYCGQFLLAFSVGVI